jgi:arabinose-5-phosphate isomerase
MDDEQIQALAVEVIEREAVAVAGIGAQLPDTFAAAVRLLLDCEGKVLVSGSGTSHAVALRFAHLLSCVGTPALFLHPGDSQHGASGAVAADDVWIGLSKGGETTEVIFLADIASKRGAKVVAITEKPSSSLGQLADVILHVTAPEGVDPFGMVATGSSLLNSAFTDAICVALLELRGYSVDDFAETHPGGAVGHKIREDDVK